MKAVSRWGRGHKDQAGWKLHAALSCMDIVQGLKYAKANLYKASKKSLFLPQNKKNACALHQSVIAVQDAVL
jgi:hypothetical protein